MKRPFRWIRRQTHDRPFSSALVILLIVIVPGYFRLESAIQQNKETAKEIVELHAFDERRDDQIALSACQTRNTANKNSRERFDQFVEVLGGLFVGFSQTPEQAERARQFVQELRAGVQSDAAAEDVDCNQDGELDEFDYNV